MARARRPRRGLARAAGTLAGSAVAIGSAAALAPAAHADTTDYAFGATDVFAVTDSTLGEPSDYAFLPAGDTFSWDGDVTVPEVNDALFGASEFPLPESTFEDIDEWFAADAPGSGDSLSTVSLPPGTSDLDVPADLTSFTVAQSTKKECTNLENGRLCIEAAGTPPIIHVNYDKHRGEAVDRLGVGFKVESQNPVYTQYGEQVEAGENVGTVVQLNPLDGKCVQGALLAESSGTVREYTTPPVC
ncbi:MAG TPA: hypothetical protein VD813_14945 [Pseudonocardia sp.]|nr:hypothetical protein [Pseudonocardia sp.]